MFGRALAWFRDALRWRWMPTLALFVGSVLFVLVTSMAVPSEISFSSSPETAADLAAEDRSEAALPESEAVESATDATATKASRRQKRARRRTAAAAAEAPAPVTDSEAPPAP